MKKKTALCLLALALAATGCTSKPEPGSPGASPGGTARFKIALIAKSSTNPVFLSARTGAEAAARELSQKHGITIEIAWLTPPQEDGQVQAQRIVATGRYPNAVDRIARHDGIRYASAEV